MQPLHCLPVVLIGRVKFHCCTCDKIFLKVSIIWHFWQATGDKYFIHMDLTEHFPGEP